MSPGLIFGMGFKLSLMSFFSSAKAGAISMAASGEPSGFFGTSRPADWSQSAARAVIIFLAVSALSAPAAFLTGANSCSLTVILYLFFAQMSCFPSFLHCSVSSCRPV